MDIILLALIFSRFIETIWPICLPDKAEFDQNTYEDIGMILAGYGPAELGEILTAESFTGCSK